MGLTQLACSCTVVQLRLEFNSIGRAGMAALRDALQQAAEEMPVKVVNMWCVVVVCSLSLSCGALLAQSGERLMGARGRRQVPHQLD